MRRQKIIRGAVWQSVRLVRRSGDSPTMLCWRRSMNLPPQRWLYVVLLATALVFLGVVVYLYGFRFSAWIDSDAAVSAVLAAKGLHAKLPVVGDWYYVNGDVWVLA